MVEVAIDQKPKEGNVGWMRLFAKMLGEGVVLRGFEKVVDSAKFEINSS